MPPSVSPVAARNAFSAAVSASVASSSSAWRRTVPRMSRHVRGLFELTAPGARRSRRSHEALAADRLPGDAGGQIHGRAEVVAVAPQRWTVVQPDAHGGGAAGAPGFVGDP